MRRVRAAAAIGVLAALSMPGAAALASASHLSAHHESHPHHDAGDHERDLSVVWHGHSHGAATPDHEHAFLLAGMHPLQVPNPKVLPLPPHAAVAVATAVDTVRGVSPLQLGQARPLGGVGPPHLERLSVLRI